MAAGSRSVHAGTGPRCTAVCISSLATARMHSVGTALGSHSAAAAVSPGRRTALPRCGKPLHMESRTYGSISSTLSSCMCTALVGSRCPVLQSGHITTLQLVTAQLRCSSNSKQRPAAATTTQQAAVDCDKTMLA